MEAEGFRILLSVDPAGVPGLDLALDALADDAGGGRDRLRPAIPTPRWLGRPTRGGRSLPATATARSPRR